MTDGAAATAATGAGESNQNNTGADGNTEGTEQRPDPAIERLSADLEKERGKHNRVFAELTNVKKSLERFKDIDPDKVKALDEEVENLRREAAESSPEKMKEWKKQQEERIKAQADAERKSWEDKLIAAEKRTKELEAEKRKLLITDRIAREHGQKIAAGAQRHFMRDADEALDFEDGEEIVRDENKQVRYARAGVRMTHAEWVEEHLRNNPILAASTYNGGGQTTGQKAAASGQTTSKSAQLPVNWQSMGVEEKRDWMLQNPETAKTLVKF